MKKFYLMIFAVVTLAGMLAISGCKKKETYTVTFNANGGTGTMVAQTFTEGEAQALTRNAFTYDGYTFTGWNTVPGGSGASYTDGQTITTTSDMTLYAQWTSSTPRPTPSSTHEYVDLGLPSGAKWATCNVGSDTPEGFGDYFAWGEITPKEVYGWSTYKYADGSYGTLTKYCNNAEYGYHGFTDVLTTLEASDDAATANWVAGWRMPTREEFDELINNCAISWTTQNEVNGLLFTSNINGNSIFLPAAGYRNVSEYIGLSSSGSYWSNSLCTSNPHYSWSFGFNSDNPEMGEGYRRSGFSVRPVCAQ